LKSLFFDWHPVIVDLLDNTEVITRRDTTDRDRLRSWGDGRVTLLGDAAHAMTFDLGQGAGSALSDAVTLGYRLRTQKPVVDALRAYENDRRLTAGLLQSASRKIGASAHQRGIGPIVNEFFLRRFGPTLTPRIFELDAKAQNQAVGDITFH
jgi:salicylate hydroxylase